MSSPIIPIHMKIAQGIISSIAILLQTDLEAELMPCITDRQDHINSQQKYTQCLVV